MPAQNLTPLVLRFGAFGDMILMIPALRLLAGRYGQPCELVSSGRWTRVLMDRVPAVEHCEILTSRRAPYWFNRSQRDVVAWMRRRPEGPVYVFEPDEKCHALLARAGIGHEWICSMRDHPIRNGEHILDHSLRLARETPAALRNQSAYAITGHNAPGIRPTLREADMRDCATWLDGRGIAACPLILLQPGNKKTMRRGSRHRASNVKYWPEANWARVATEILAALPNARVILCGSPEERPLAEEIAGLVGGPDRIVIATDDLPIPRLLALQARAHSMVSVDTGPAHSAAAMGCPLVVLFSRSTHCSAELYAPRTTTAPVKIVQPESTSTDATVSAIAPESVVSAWKALGTAADR